MKFKTTSQLQDSYWILTERCVEKLLSVMTARLEISSAGYPDGGFCTSYVPVVVVAGNTMRPTPLERLPQSEVHVHIGYVADELCESVKIIYEFEVRH